MGPVTKQMINSSINSRLYPNVNSSINSRLYPNELLNHVMINCPVIQTLIRFIFMNSFFVVAVIEVFVLQ